VGLGNPGARYAGNRHNIGAMVLDELAARAGSGFKASSAQRSQLAAVRLGTLPGGRPGPRAVLAKPMGYMNESGGPVSLVTGYFDVAARDVAIVHDDLDLPFGTVRLKRGGGEGGHNGLRDISKALGTKDYIRVRCGIGRPPGRMDPKDYVLKDFPPAARTDLALEIDRAADAATAIVLEGLDAAQLRFHTEGAV
jgi:PTH1 family peptidyl-tRNA hydrolase